MQQAETEQEKRAFVDEVVSRFGLLPNFFCSAPSAAGLVQELWKFAKSGYLDCPLPSLLKERLFVHLSRFCEVRYCIVRHVGFLIGEGRPAGDASVLPQTIEQALTLLRRPLPDADGLSRCFERLESRARPVEIPDPETQLESDLFDALTIMFVEPTSFGACTAGRDLRTWRGRFEILTAFLAFVRTAHYWTETHPMLPYEADMQSLMAKHSELARLLTRSDRGRAGESRRGPAPHACGIAEDSRRAGTESKRRCASLRSGFAAALRAAHMAFWVWDPATDPVSASDTMDELYGLPSGERFDSSRPRLCSSCTPKTYRNIGRWLKPRRGMWGLAP